jgi:hypothetical protein
LKENDHGSPYRQYSIYRSSQMAEKDDDRFHGLPISVKGVPMVWRGME